MIRLCSQGENGVCRATIGGGNDDPLRAYAWEDAEKHVAAIREAKLHDDEDQQRPGPSYTAFQRKSLDIPPWIGMLLSCSIHIVGKSQNLCRLIILSGQISVGKLKGLGSMGALIGNSATASKVLMLLAQKHVRNKHIWENTLVETNQF